MSSERVRAAAVQMDVRWGEIKANLDRVLQHLEEAVQGGAELVVFPECALSGYCFEGLEESAPYALRAGDGPLQAFAERCAQLGVTGVVGFLEREGEQQYNSALLARPDGSWAVYRKTHLPTLGIDRFVARGDRLPVFSVPFGRMGILICYDVRFPEAPRVLGLSGAEVIALPTNWPVGAESSPDFITRARAWENRVWIVAANRVGVERGRRFIGRSQIVTPSGEVLQEAPGDKETILIADLDLRTARQKAIVYEPGAWELDITGDRNPALYRRLVEATDGV
ncbi:MAG: amidohydrolase [Candidatus Poribacteria bacterium]|nr:MAG: amidohydrolase [Candidatus Poribacteria bacterium]